MRHPTFQRMRPARVLGPLLFFVACAAPSKEPDTPPGKQSYREAVELLCTVDQRVGVGSTDDPISTSRRRWDFIDERVKHPHGIYQATLLRVGSGQEQAQLLGELASEVGLSECPLACAAAKLGI